uniref:Terminase large subunit n=1 Tax=Podoviridae sp. ctz6O13 TaxID=2827757 RepID=A0A8S5TKW4_9CAUD|nr:MAG TPA: Terminase large subunit [Podoviridae sp. ctz6O13]
MVPGMTDHRGYCDEEACKAHLQAKRDQYLNVPQSLIHHCAEYCWNAEEAFALEGDNKFNKVLLSEQMALIRLHKTGPRPVNGFIDYTYKDGVHKPENINGFKWLPTKDGKVQILEHPVWSENYQQDLNKREREARDKGLKWEPQPAYKEMHDLYVAGVDGIDIGKNQTSSETRGASDFCIIIYKRAFGLNEPQIVCMYKDRPNEVRTAYKTAMCLIRYYNCKVNVEATRVGFINWARYSNQLKWFMRRPQATLQNVKSGNSKSYGTPATATIIGMQTDLIADFIEDYCHTIWFEEILDQMVRYNPENKTKFDVIAALGMVMLADQELTGRTPAVITQAKDEFVDFGYYIDEDGYRKWGTIPKQTQMNARFGGGQAYDPYRVDTSDTRYYQDHNT